MTSTRWDQIKELFNETLALSKDEREQFLTNAANGDAELLGEVKSLLTSAANSDDEEHPTNNFFSIGNNDFNSLIGTHIGPFKVLREVARGGMGVVLEGIREDEFKQRVAIKIIRAGIGSEEIVRRFRAERSVLSRLDHPNIAKFLDGGNLPDARLPDGQGTPYLIMEFIEGVPIDAHCDEKKLDVRSRLELFSSVCSAVHYAHQNLVVHRDLKPSNILVTEHGVKLLDFGIAKLLKFDERGETTEETLAATQMGSRFLTPEYASPEQIQGRNVTTASDTYSLGVLLYKLLTGERPYRFASSALRDVEHAITDVEPTKPSAVVLKSGQVAAELRSTSKPKLSKLLSGDLDTILLKTLQKEPARRYHSVQEFSEDIRRYLAGLPVVAQGDAISYRFAKYVRRNTIAVTAVLLILASLTAGIISSLWQANRAALERDRAIAEAEKSQQVVRVLNEMLSAADLTRATKKDVTVAEVLEQASTRVEKDFANQPEIAADVLATVGSTYQGLQLFDKAEAAKRKVLQLQTRLYGNEHPKVAEALHTLGEFYHLQENRAAAESLYNQSLTIFRKFNQPSREFATALNDYGVFVQDEGKYALADSLLLAALSIYRQIPGDNRKDIATSLHNFALSKDWQGQLTAADSLYRESLRMQRDVYGNNNVQIAITIGNLGFIAEARGDFSEAERLFRESLAIRRSLLTESHSDVAANKIKLGLFLIEHSSQYQEAEQLCREALAALTPKNPNLKRLIARAYLGIGRALQRQRRIPEAEQELRKAVGHFAQMQPFNAKSIADAEVSLAENLIMQKHYGEAEQQLQNGRNALRNAAADSSSEMRKTNQSLSDLYARWKKQ